MFLHLCHGVSLHNQYIIYIDMICLSSNLRKDLQRDMWPSPTHIINENHFLLMIFKADNIIT